MSRIVLVGFPGCGKTSVGKRLAERLGLHFIDLDTAIEEKYRESIPMLFHRYGESVFRKCEFQTLKECLGNDDVLISTGGGAPCKEGVMELINQYACSVYLQVSEPRLVALLRKSKKPRPLISGMDEQGLAEYVHNTLQVRAPFYQKAKIIVDAENLDLDKIIDQLKSESFFSNLTSQIFNLNSNNTTMKIIGITGTLGAGKGTIVDYLINHYGYKHYSVRGYLIEEATRRGMEINRDTFVEVANDLRATHCPSYIVDELYKQAEKAGCNAIIESVRTPGEVESLRKNEHFLLFAVDADPKIRYERIVNRGSETDHVSYETFIENEQREMSSTDPNHQNVGKCMEMADYVFHNDGDFDDLYRQVEEALNI